MHSTLSRRTLLVVGISVAVLATVIAVLLATLPPVVGLGNRVRLPLFHGGVTWVVLMTFTLMGVAALAHLLSRDERAYAWEVGLRAVACPLWLFSSVLGMIAAAQTWDFSGSRESVISMIPRDPRLSAQLLLLAGVAVLLVADWMVLDKRRHKSVLDLVYVVGMWVLLANIFLDPVKRALHPDSPVMNSGWEIKAPFFTMVAAIFAIALVLSWVATSFVRVTTATAEDDEGIAA